MKEKLEHVFLAAVDNSTTQFDVRVLIVNTNPEPVVLTARQHSIQSDEGAIMDLGSSGLQTMCVPANGAIEIDHIRDGGELDFVTEYWVEYEGTRYCATISGHSFYFGPRSKLEIPVIHRIGYMTAFQ